MDPSDAQGSDDGTDEWSDEPEDGERSVDISTEPAPGPRIRRPSPVVVLAGIALVAVLAAVNGTWSPARAVQHRLEVISDYEPPRAGSPVSWSAPQVTVPASASSTTWPAPVVSVAPAAPATTAPAADPSTTATTVVVEPVQPVEPEVTTPEVTDPALVSRPIPAEVMAPAEPVRSPWANVSRTTSAGYVATDAGCASGTSASALDAFFAQRMGPVIGHDYQHVYPLGGGRFLWLFQDTFVDYSGRATNLGQATFDHNTAMIQDGACFTLYHRGSIERPTSFENGTGESRLAKWFWPMGGQAFDGKVYVFWAEMQKDGYEPAPPNGLGWHPSRTWLAVYDAGSLARLSFAPAPNSGVLPVYGYAVDSDAEFTYLFGNTFEQNLQREGGYFNGPHSGTRMWLARVPRGQFSAPVEYRTADGWSFDADQASPIVQRYWAENPMQPRYIGGQWVAATKVNGYWGESLSIDVANDPWGPWTTTETRGLPPRGGDPLMNTYHAHLMPWLEGGSVVVSVSQNARNMLRDAWPAPSRYRLAFSRSPLVAPPAREVPPVDSTTTVPETTTTIVDTTTTTATPDPTTSTSVAVDPTTTLAPTTTSSTTTTAPPQSSTTTSTTSVEPPASDATTTSSVPPG